MSNGKIPTFFVFVMFRRGGITPTTKQTNSMFLRKTYLLLSSLLIVMLSSCSDNDSEPEIRVTSLEVIPTSITLSEGETYELSISIKPNEASGAHVSWVSSDTKVATVVNGKVTAVAEGTATITASAGNCKAECKVIVYPASWIDPEFAEVLEENGYIKDASTVTPLEVETITKIVVSGPYTTSGTLTSLKGIEYFSALKELYCDNNQITALDVSKNTQLEYLDCFKNNLTALDVSNNTQLITLRCGNNKLTSLDVSKSTQLASLTCYENNLTALDVSKNTQLQLLNCRDTQLTVLDVSKNTQLTELNCAANNLTALDISRNTHLGLLSCGDNNLTALDVSKSTQLTGLYCESNNLSVLDVSRNTQLTELYCYENQLTVLDISKNTSLKEFMCNDNPGSNGQFRVKAWFDNNSVPSDIYLGVSSGTYNGSTVSIYYYK